VQFTVAYNIKRCSLKEKAVRLSQSHFTLSLVTTPTERLIVEVQYDSKKTILFCWIEK
jgi:hypothetical protein